MASQLGEEAAPTLAFVEEEIKWLEEHTDETKETYDERQKAAEDRVRPVLVKL